MEVSSQLHVPAALQPAKYSWVAIELETGWAPEPVRMLWTREIALVPSENQTPAVQHVARHYAD
jgi:hypothetical protein